MLAVINNFIKMKIIASFDDFFVEPYRHSPMAIFINKSVAIDKFRKNKIYIKKEMVYQVDAIAQSSKNKAIVAPKKSETDLLREDLQKLKEMLDGEHRKSMAQQIMIGHLMQNARLDPSMKQKALEKFNVKEDPTEDNLRESNEMSLLIDRAANAEDDTQMQML